MTFTFFISGSAKIKVPDLGQHGSSKLFRLLEEQGFILRTTPPGDYFLSLNHNKKSYQDFIRSGGTAIRSILIRTEPPSVFPAQYSEKIETRYGLVISPGMVNHGGESKLFIGWPYEHHRDPNNPEPNCESTSSIFKKVEELQDLDFDRWNRRKIMLSMIAANKVGAGPQENYAIRRQVAKSISRDILQVYGSLWTESYYLKVHHRLAVANFAISQGTFPNMKSIYGNLFYRYQNAFGSIPDKHIILRDSKFSLVIENSNSTISEKLFDSLINGAIPIYVGPSLKDAGLPEDVAISTNGEPKEILNILKEFDKAAVESMLTRIREFVSSTTFINHWTAEKVFPRILTRIKQHINLIDQGFED